jgi:radical SAM superfamily enzyme YgiQ (UPF0313 family)
MRVLLVNPSPGLSFWTYSQVSDITDCPGYMPNLALPTLAALTPDGVEVTLMDETVEPIDYDRRWDVVGITGYVTQKLRIFEIADRFRERGQLVAIGGPYASLSPSSVRPHADILFIGEAEKTWPQFLADFQAGRWRTEYRAIEAVDIHSSPVPDFRGMRNSEYFQGVVQTSRGCPFECEFCDVIVYLGRKQRHKYPERVVEELENLYQTGYRRVYLSDDNFTASRQKAAEIMTAVGQWNRKKAEPVFFSTQLSIDIARDRDIELLKLCVNAGLKQAFIGIETPNPAALREVKKRQNVRVNLVADIHRVQRCGMMVQAGMINGFDADTADSFRTQYEFLQEAGTPMVAVSVLNAPEGTPLEKRMRAENRLKIDPVNDFFADTNIIPKRMTSQQLSAGTHWLLNRLFDPKAFVDRVRVLAQNLPETTADPLARSHSAFLWQKVIASYEQLGPEFQTIVRDTVRLFRKKDTQTLCSALIFYKHVVCMLRKWGIWDPSQACLDSPDFGCGTEESNHAGKRSGAAIA